MAPFIAAVIALCPIQTRADMIALSFTPSGTTVFGGAGSDTFGWGFSLSSPLLVTQLGVWDENGDGLGQSHPVTIWDSTGSPVAQVTVPFGTGPETNGFRYVPIGSVPLAAGNYTIGAFYGALGTDVASASASAISTAPGVTYTGSRSIAAIAGNAFPPTDAVLGIPNSYFGPNFQFTSPTAVPDTGSTFALLFLSLIVLLGANRFCSLRLT
jgi:VPDSG-CTERM motif